MGLWVRLASTSAVSAGSLRPTLAWIGVDLSYAKVSSTGEGSLCLTRLVLLVELASTTEINLEWRGWPQLSFGSRDAQPSIIWSHSELVGIKRRARAQLGFWSKLDLLLRDLDEFRILLGLVDFN